MALVESLQSHSHVSRKRILVPCDFRLHFFPSYVRMVKTISSGKIHLDKGNSSENNVTDTVFDDCIVKNNYILNFLSKQDPSIVSLDLITVSKEQQNFGEYNDIVLSSCLAQMQLLMKGSAKPGTFSELKKKAILENRISGFFMSNLLKRNIASNFLFLKELTPTVLGSLIALYEHKEFIQNIIEKATD
jgi:glucose-6-phosphate isomerase